MILTVDIGSSSVRALLFDDRGRALESAGSRRSHRFTVVAGGGVEADADHLLDLVVACIDETLARATEGGEWATEGDGRASAGGDRRIDGVAFCTFWHGTMGVSADGRAITPVLTWADTRAAQQAAGLGNRPDSEAVRQRTGCPPHPSYFPSKLLWMRENLSDFFRQVDWWCSIGEYCFNRFFGQRLCSFSMASGTGLFDRHSLRWDPDILDSLSLAESRLSPLDNQGSPLRGLREPFAARWPALRDVPWYPALGDGACSNIGCGCTGPERMAVMIGTTGAMRVVLDSGGSAARPCACSVPRGLWCYLVDRRRALAGGVLSDGGSLFEWMSGALALGQTPNEIDAALREAEPAGHGLTVLPFLSGERSVGWDPLARGAVIGMRLQTRAQDILQAGMEAVAYRFAAILALLGGVVPAATEIIGTGGALLASPAWCQIIADVLELPVRCAAVPESSSRGAALLALESLGRIPGIDVEPPAMGPTFLPRREYAGAHRHAALEQQRLYDALKLSGPPG